jgi:hypothetical protein
VGGPPEHAWIGDAEPAGEGGDNLFARVKNASQVEKIQLALHGGKTERAALLRETNKTIHGYVLRNPNIGIDEVGQLARNALVAPDVLALIAGRKEWVARPEIAAALIRNPKTPVPLAIQMIAHVAPAELRQLAKSGALRAPVLAAVRKKVIG